MLIAIDTLLDYHIPEPHDVLLQIEAAAMTDQRILSSRLTVTSPERLGAVAGEEAIGQRTWAAGAGQFRAEYHAQIEIDRVVLSLATLHAGDPRALPALVVPYLLPSRYCESDRFEAFVQREFSEFEGGAKIAAMCEWIDANVDYVSGASNGETSAADTFVQRQGVCRDFAHLLAGFARAAMIPARLVSAYAPDVTPPDFHAVVEVWLDASWHLVDATGMAEPSEIVRICVGRDATDIAFMTVFGTADFREQRVTVTRA